MIFILKAKTTQTFPRVDSKLSSDPKSLQSLLLLLKKISIKEQLESKRLR
jgi:hypothetical protein